MKKFKKIPTIYSKKRQGRPKVLEIGDNIWNENDGKKRQKIIEEIGPEWKQINYLAGVVIEIIKNTDGLDDNPIIQEALAIFNRVNEIRNS